MLRTANLFHPASTQTSRSTPGVSLSGTLASPRTELSSAGCRELIARSFHKRAIHFTGVRSTSCGGYTNRQQALPEVLRRASRLVPNRRRLPRLPGLAQVARRFRVSRLLGSGRLAHRGRALDVCGLLEANINNGGHDLPGHSHAAHGVVRRCLESHDAEEWHLGPGAPAGPRARFLSDRLDDAAPISHRNGTTRPRVARR